MKQITTKQFIGFLCGDRDAAASILSVSQDKLNEMIDYDQVLDSYSNRLANYLFSQYQPQSKEDALRIALHRADSKLARAYQSITSMDPILDL